MAFGTWTTLSGFYPSGMLLLLLEENSNAGLRRVRLRSVRFQVLTAASMKMAVFWVVAPRRLVEVYRRFRGACCLHHQGGTYRPDNGGTSSTSKTSVNFQPDYTALQPRRQPSSYSPPWEPEILLNQKTCPRLIANQVCSVASRCVMILISHFYALTVHSSNYMFRPNVAIIRYEYMFEVTALG
jgi:hypothetical protein